jgi:hypothetical protein
LVTRLSFGVGTEVTFPPRTVTAVRLEITEVSPTTLNIGLAELQVFSISGSP